MWVLFGMFFIFTNFYILDLHNKTRVALANLQLNICKNQIEIHTFPNVVMVIGLGCLLIFLIAYVGLPNRVHR